MERARDEAERSGPARTTDARGRTATAAPPGHAAAVLALQRTAGNRAVSQLIQRETFHYDSSTGQAGTAVTVTVDDGLISVTGTLAPAGGPPVHCKGSLDFKVDDRNPKRLVIGTVFTQPEGSGLGGLLGMHLAQWGQARGMTSIGTDLTAPTASAFYTAIGLEPSQETVGLATHLVSGMPGGTPLEIDAREAQRHKLVYSAPLNAPLATVLERATASAARRWTRQGLFASMASSVSSWFSK